MNCRGLGEQRKRRDVMHYIRNAGFNVVFLQDTHMTTRSSTFFNSLWRGKCYHSCYSSRSRGTCILIDNNVQHSLIAEIMSDCGNYVIVICKVNRDTFAFINIYGPNRDSPNFFSEVLNHLEDVEVDHVILAGDLNFTIDSDIDCLNYVREHNVNAKLAFLQQTDKYNLIDIWRHAHPAERKYTWIRKNPFQCGRLDMFFVSDHLINSVAEVSIIPGYRTDHSAITLTVQTQQQPRGNGLWMFNVSHLLDEEYVQHIKSCISDAISQYAVPMYQQDTYHDYKNYPLLQLTISDCLFYETLIMLLRGESVKFAKQKAKQRRAREDSLKEEVAKAQEKFTATALESDANLLHIAQDKLEEARQPTIDGLIVRSRVAWHQNGERNSKYFLSLEKRNYKAKCIQYIELDNRVITQTKTILSEFTRNLQNKYSATNETEINEMQISTCLATSLYPSKNLELDAVLTLQDLTKALFSMKKGKTPGSNGFSVEFFRAFWSELGPFLHRAFTESLSRGQAMLSHREGIVKLIPKQGKSPHALKGWRPITLLNVDFKIVSSAIAMRFKSVISEIIGPSQTAYIAGRYIGENTRLLFDTIALTHERKMPGMILAADFEAAFESVSWEYLRSVLRKLNFGPHFRNIIDLLYLNPCNYSRIMLNGHLGPQIYLKRGIRQGDPSSGFLFNMAVEVLAGQINKSNRITGISISPSKELRISQYADDTILLLNGSDASLKGAIDELLEFSKLSGLKVNVEKTSCLPIGTLNGDQIANELNIKVVGEIKILGIHVSKNIDTISERNIQIKLPAIRRDIEQWKRRSLTPIGRICIVKALLLSKLVHLFMALPNPTDTNMKQIETMLFNFIWDGKGDKIKRTKMVQHFTHDGLKMVDIHAFLDSMKLAWLKRFMVSSADWTYIANQQLPTAAKLLTYGKEKLIAIRKQVKNPFYADLLRAIIRFNMEYEPSSEEILSETIWFSNHTRFSKTIVKQWDEKGLRFISDLFDPATSVLYSKEQLTDRYKINMTFLCYESLVRSLPNILRNSTEKLQLSNPNIPFKINTVMNKPKFSKHAYDVFIKALAQKNLATDQRIKDKWDADIGDHVVGTCWEVMNATASTYLLYLHYRIIMRIFPTNKFLHTIQIVQTNDCSFRCGAIETLTHLFWVCPKVKIFIKEVLSHLKRRYNKTMSINATKWFFLSNVSSIDALVITMAKYVIHKARMNNAQPVVSTMINVLKIEANKEYNGAKAINQVEKFEKKWGELGKILEDVN